MDNDYIAMPIVDYEESGSEASPESTPDQESDYSQYSRTTFAPMQSIEPSGLTSRQIRLEPDLVVLYRLQTNFATPKVADSNAGPYRTAKQTSGERETSCSKNVGGQDERTTGGSMKRKRDLPVVDMQQLYKQSIMDRLKHKIPETKRIYAINGGKHQMHSLVRNAQDNKEALEQQFKKNKEKKRHVKPRYRL